MTRRATRKPVTSCLLFVLALILLAAGISRLGLGVVDAIAAETGNDLPVAEPAPVAEPPTDPADLFETLRAREARLARIESELDARRATLLDAEQELAQRLDDLIAAEEQLRTTLRLTESAAEDDLRQLTAVFENMKPQQAADLFSQMDTEFSAGFIARLRPETAAEILSGLDPMIAYAISAVLAGRHARTPRH